MHDRAVASLDVNPLEGEDADSARVPRESVFNAAVSALSADLAQAIIAKPGSRTGSVANNDETAAKPENPFDHIDCSPVSKGRVGSRRMCPLKREHSGRKRKANGRESAPFLSEKCAFYYGAHRF
jgi:hypothetical protein